MRHCSVQVRGLLTRDELDRYNGLIEAGSFLEDQNRYDLAYVVQKEIDLLILPAIERLKDKGRARDRATAEYLESLRNNEDSVEDEDEDEDEDEGNIVDEDVGSKSI